MCLLGGNYERGRSNQAFVFLFVLLMRGDIVPPSKLIVTICFSPQGFVFIGGLLGRGGGYYSIT